MSEQYDGVIRNLEGCNAPPPGHISNDKVSLHTDEAMVMYLHELIVNHIPFHRFIWDITYGSPIVRIMVPSIGRSQIRCS